MTRSEAIARLQAEAGPVRALGATALYLFGSTAADAAQDGSDLGLFIAYDPSRAFSLLDLVSTSSSTWKSASGPRSTSPRATACIPACASASSGRPCASSDGTARPSACP
ncbi:hypothetical protein [Methylobacterium sp.]|uniref:hypothetical protein n=1 Tax=Methylobacterium sp. TaxID=409 RepID=UPI00338D8601